MCVVAEPTPTLFARSPDGDRIAYRTLGHGRVPIVLFHPNMCVDLYWDDPVFAAFMNQLAEVDQVITLDWRGLGASDPLPEGEFPTLEAWADDARVVLDAVGAERAYILACHPLAAGALMFAATQSRRTAGLILVDGWARFLWDDDYRFGLPADVVDRFIDALVDRVRTPEGAFDTVPSRAHDPKFAEFLARVSRQAGSAAFSNRLLKWAMRLDVRGLLSVIECPTLVVQPMNHPYLVPAFSEYLVEHIDGARLVTRSGIEDIAFSRPDSEEVATLVHEIITGAPPTRFDRERSLATILFTDIVGSTNHASRLGDQAWLGLLAEHDAAIDRELQRFRGRKVNPTGDGMVAIFDGPARAIHCTQAISTVVRSLGLEMRAGLHAGEIEHRGSDIGGIAVHVAARILALAGPGDILVSKTVTDLAMGSGLSFSDRGDHELKAVPGTWRLFAVES